MKSVMPLLLLAMLPVLAHADLRVFACEPEWGALAEEIGGDKVVTSSATTPFQDPHYIQARPSLIASVRRADLVACSGAQLEIGWLPVLLQKANNRRVMPGADGYFEASSFVVRLEATGNVDRSQGDIHPQGNPHVQTNPHNVAIIAGELARRMGQLDPDNKARYDAGLAAFTDKWRDAMARWEARAAPLRGKRVITHHKSWVYLERWLGLEEVANLEPVPGVPPTVSHLSELVSQFGNRGADFIVRAPYQDERASQWLADRSGIPPVMLPLTVGGSDGATDLFAWFDDILDRLLGALPND
ncbi:MAG TPA: zinc ABC transporter substrate-binding protein [Woeseiaceae bacterium]|nr:zinc ABC transporter substrate-binding protein [Woeseiaceae bacterium]